MTKKYDANFVDEVMELDDIPDERKALSLAKKYGRKTELEARLKELGSGYRRKAVDITKLVHEVCSEESLEQKAMAPSVYQTLADIVGTVGAGTLNVLKKSKIYYPFVGALRAEHQAKIAKKLGDNQDYYTGVNLICESIGIALAAGYSLDMLGAPLAGSITLGLMGGIVYMSIGGIIRGRMAERSPHKACGSLFAMPFYALYYAASAIGKSYSSVWEKRKEKRRILQLEQETKPLRIESAPESIDDSLIEAEQEVEESLAPIKHYYNK